MNRDEIKRLSESGDVQHIIREAFMRQQSAMSIVRRCGIQDPNNDRSISNADILNGCYVPRPLATYLTSMRAAIAQLNESVQIIEDCLEVDNMVSQVDILDFFSMREVQDRIINETSCLLNRPLSDKEEYVAAVTIDATIAILKEHFRNG